MSARDEVLAKMAKKTKQFKEYKDRSLGYVRPEKLVAEFIQAIEKAHDESKVGLAFTQEVDRAYQTLCHRMRRWDKDVFVEVVWSREEQAETWVDLRPSGVRIVWSDAYKLKNPTQEGEVFVSVEQMFLEGL